MLSAIKKTKSDETRGIRIEGELRAVGEASQLNDGMLSMNETFVVYCHQGDRRDPQPSITIWCFDEGLKLPEPNYSVFLPDS